MKRAVLAAALALAAPCAGCITARVVPPPGKPLPVAPRVASGNVVLDVVGQRHADAAVYQERGAPGERLVPLCTTPCGVDLKPGRYTLRFSDPKDCALTGTAEIEVPPTGRILVRHALGYERPLPGSVGFGGLVLGGVGLVGVLVGGSTAIAGSSDPSQDAGTRALGGLMLGLGGLMTAAAWTMLHAYRGERQEGATTVAPIAPR